MSIKHTPGPYDHHKLGNDADQWGIGDSTGRTIGLSYHGEANAQLMAAAPDLLAALEKAQQHIDQLCHTVNTLSNLLGLGDKVRAEDFKERIASAIDKATRQ